MKKVLAGFVATVLLATSVLLTPKKSEAFIGAAGIGGTVLIIVGGSVTFLGAASAAFDNFTPILLVTIGLILLDENGHATGELGRITPELAEKLGVRDHAEDYNNQLELVSASVMSCNNLNLDALDACVKSQLPTDVGQVYQVVANTLRQAQSL